MYNVSCIWNVSIYKCFSYLCPRHLVNREPAEGEGLDNYRQYLQEKEELPGLPN